MPQPNLLAPARYLKAVHLPTQLPPDEGVEIAIAGRSNAGKSSAINAICETHKLARTSKTPGRTQQLVYFEVAPARYLVDLPGYGYAEVPAALREHWRGLIDGYLRERASLRGLLLVMDIRHPLREFDRLMLDYGMARGLAVHILLTKADKLPRGQQAKALQAVRNALEEVPVGVQLFSSLRSLGIPEARAWLEGQLGLRAAAD
ncbi:ribosome biogenesis GTP-binding protein YihA/YsxC [Pseudomarimonas salicorniae]|uniref:Probable GTP-binding protein EngB n=1 Tax=Pseudomarimonas salicorniae TaxID=2933270 RepID=A0ABT0GGP1_9GAMM|nr:ribosome biogenesis GTP-binding protein YihA/YsxC [Lysobacter sp. CAU 1642]MCK7593369.1 ribosome biogenesis GTP-binding protein YihA/YsxC [Lysobacter sp. CAU 1642]